MEYPVKKAIVLGVIGTVCVAGSMWLSLAVARAIAVPDASDWLVPVVAASLAGTAFLVFAVLARRTVAVIAVAGGMGLAVPVAAPSPLAVLVTVVVAYLLIQAWRAVRHSVEGHLQIAVFAYAQQGAPRLVLALSLAISGVLFYTIAHTDAATLIMSGSMRSAFRGPLARMVMPSPLTQGTGPGGQATVDDFLQAIAANASNPAAADESIGVRFMEDYAGAVSDRVRSAAMVGPAVQNTMPVLSPTVLMQMREDLGREMGMNLTGQELVSDVFVASLERNMRSYAEKNLLPQGYRYGTALTGVITFFLFMTIWGIGAVLQIVWSVIAKIAVGLLLRTGAVAVTRRIVEKEEIA